MNNTENNVENKNRIMNWDKGQTETSRSEKGACFNELPEEMIVEIFSYLNGEGLVTCSLINRQWKELVDDEIIRRVANKKQWNNVGNIGRVSRLPKDIGKILESPCPFWEGKKVRETHRLVFIPATIDGKPLTMEPLVEYMKAHEVEYKKAYEMNNPTGIDDHHPIVMMFNKIQRDMHAELSIWGDIRDFIIEEYRNQPVTKSHWVLITNDIIPNSVAKRDSEQEQMIAEIAEQSKIDYQVPKLLDVFISLFIKPISSIECLFNNDKQSETFIFTRCQEDVLVKGAKFHAVVGALLGSPPHIDVNYGANFGIAAQRTLFCDNGVSNC